MSLFAGYARQVEALPRAAAPAPPPTARGLFGGTRRPREWGGLQTFLMGTDARDEAIQRQRQEEELRQRTMVEDRLRSQLSPMDTAAGSGTGALPGIDQQMAALEEARLLNPQVAEQFAPVVQSRRLESMTGKLPLNERLAVMLNPERAGQSFATQFEDMTLAKGTQRSRGGQIIAEAPDNVTVNDTIYGVSSRGAQPLVTAPPGYDDETARISANTVNVAPRNQVFRDGQLYVENTQPTPLSDADQRAIADAEARLAALDTSLTRAAEIERQIGAGELNLNPVANTVAGLRNAAGMSNQNSLNYDALLSWAREARNAILQANTGVQTDQDAVRELETILSGTRDERIVAAALQRFQEARRATRDVFQRDIQRRSGQGQPQPQQRQSVPPPPFGFVLD
jgi:hypothetical protein